MRPNPILPLTLVLAGGLLAGGAIAQQSVVIYRCTDASGAVTVQNDRPCPRGSTQNRRVLQTPAAPARTARAGEAGSAPGSTAGAPPVTTTPAGALAPGTPAPGTPSGVAPAATAGSPALPGPATSTPAAGTVAPVPPVPTPAPGTYGVGPAATTSDRPAPPPLFECRTFDNTVYLGENATPPPRCAPLQVTGVAGTGAPAGAACEVVTDRCEAVPAAVLCDRWRQRLRDLGTEQTFGRLDERPNSIVEVDRIRQVVDTSTCGPVTSL